MTKTAASVLLAVLLCAAAYAQRGKSPEPPATVAVCVTGGFNESERDALGSSILNALVASGRFTAAAHASAFTAEAGKALSAQSGETVDDGYIGRMGKQYGARYVCIAGVSQTPSGFYTVSGRMFDVEKAKVTASGRTYGQLNSMQALTALSIDVAMEMGIGVYPPQMALLAAQLPPLPVTSEPASLTPPAAPAPPLPSPPPPAASEPAPPPPAASEPPPPPPTASAPQPAALPPETPEATISIATQPSFADIYIGEKLIGRSNDGELSVPAGIQQVRFVKGGIDNTQSMTFLPGKNATTFVALSESRNPPAPPPESVGASIIIHTRPPEADVYIDGKLVGMSNRDKLTVPIGTYDVIFIKDDLEKMETMTFQPGENTMQVIQMDDGKQKKMPKSKS